ncbi:hypothetical protein [Paenibacillus sp. YPG26]|uniref:hypothetical protein n=1 Tax=Paenibacillus sp. YPG26 TaxID=2878915 RepID=UPI00203BEE50|nr:hypothetical protein [Paenibacillus sp. YPG26]USB33770.1 hypothetical protein LDO05_02795 [Paenibacillus sp. YPG26]
MKSSIALLLLAASVLTSACGTEPAVKKQADTVPVSTPSAPAENSTTPTTTNGAAAPKYLPPSLPIPEDAQFTHVQETMENNKKSSTVIFLTGEELEKLGEDYKQFFQAEQVKDSNELIDKSSIVMNGEVAGKYSLSITGGASGSKPELREITIHFDEL